MNSGFTKLPRTAQQSQLQSILRIMGFQDELFQIGVTDLILQSYCEGLMCQCMASEEYLL